MDTPKPRVLVLQSKAGQTQRAAEALAGAFDIIPVSDLTQAVQALRDSQPIDGVFAEAADFLPLERAMADHQSSQILNTLGEGVCVVDAAGRCLWANDQMRNFPPEVQERVCQTGCAALDIFSDPQPRTTPQPSHHRSKKFGFQCSDNQYFEAIVSPILDTTGKPKRTVTVVWDATGSRRLQQKIDAIDAAGRELVRLESDSICKMTVPDRLKLLEEKIVRFTTDLMHFDHFIIRLLDKKSNKLEPMIHVGLPPDALEIDLYAEPEGNGISGWVASTGRSYICHDVEKDSRYILGLGHAKSSLTVPLRLHDKVIGVFNIESQKPGAFREEDRQFAEIFGRYIAVALNVLDLLVVERYTISGRMAENVIREMAAPLNDIVTEAQTLIEEYIGNDDLRQRLDKIVDNVECLRRAVKDVSQGPKTILGTRDIKYTADAVISGKKVLVADDEANIRNTIADVLGKFGALVTICRDGHEAAEALESQPYDLVVSDIRMPHRTGYEVFAVAQRVNTELPVILMTGFGYDPSHSIVRASQEGLQAVLYKPFKVDQLLEEVRKALSKPKTAAAK